MSRRRSGSPSDPVGGRRSSPPPGWDAEHVAAYDAFMRGAHKSGSTPRQDTPGKASDRGGVAYPTYRLRWEGNDIVLPAAGNDEADAVGFSSWDDSHQRLEAFTRRVVDASGRRRRRTLATVALIHRADNTYNRRAVSVASPEVPDHQPTGRRPARPDTKGPLTARDKLRDIKRRHLGYLSDSFLRRVGVESLPALAKLAESRGGQVLCTGIVLDIDDLMLDLPLERVMAAAIQEFLAKHGVDAWQSRRPHTTRSEQTTQALSRIRHFTGPVPTVNTLALATVIDDNGHRTVRLTKRNNSNDLGAVINGHLVLGDERLRDQVLSLLLRCDSQLPRSAQATPVPSEAAGSEEQPHFTPNLHARFEPGAVTIDTRDTNGTAPTRVATYNTATQRLWIEDDRLVPPTAAYVARLGLKVNGIGVPQEPWHLTREVPRHMLRDPHAEPHSPRDRAVHLRAVNRPLVEADILGPVAWHRHPRAQLADTEPDEQFWFLERHVRERVTLFPHVTLTPRQASCRLCGRTTAEFTTPVVIGPVAYCHDCLVGASEGQPALADRRRTARAVRTLADIEFDGIPMLEDQLAALNLNPDTPVIATQIDRLLLLRFAVPRGKFPWTLILEESGIAPDGLRTGRGTLVRARDGHLCLSLRERAVCDFLHQLGIEHDREPLYPVDDVLNPRGRRRADWILADGTLVELWGMPDDPVYAAKMVEKRDLAARHNLRLIEVTDAELPHLPRLFAPWIKTTTNNSGVGDDRTAWTWSPAIITRTPITAARAATVFDPDSHDPATRSSRRAGSDNTANITARDERTTRAQQALDLAKTGSTRNEIAADLGVSLDTVKELLRDARFYADPGSDPARLALVTAAASARQAGRTRASLAAELSLSEKKAKEVWRDAENIRVPEA